MASSWNHLKALLRKNWILFKRSPGTSCCEMLIPIILVLILVAIRGLVKITAEKETSYVDSAANFTSIPEIPPFIYDFIVHNLTGNEQTMALELLYANFHLK